MSVFPQREMTFREENGTEARFRIRPYERGDEEGIVDCIREEYGETYFKRDFYRPEKVMEYAQSGRVHFFVAERDGFIAGMVILSIFNDMEDYIEPASHILHKNFRGRRLGAALAHYALDMGKGLRPCSLFVHAVTFHRSTQILCENYGMVPVGFRLGTFLKSRMFNSYRRGKCEKYSEGVLILPVAKRDAGIVYLPEEVEAFGRRIYGKLGVDAVIRTAAAEESASGSGSDRKLYREYADALEALEEEPQLQIRTDYLQRMALVRVRRSGRRIADRMRELIASFAGEPGWTIQITLCTSSPIIFYEYGQLRRLSFFFTGLKPLCGKEEQMYMQWIGDVDLHMEEYTLTDSFQILRGEIEAFYRNRDVH